MYPKDGNAKLLRDAKGKMAMPKCGDALCCHNGICFNCALEKLQGKKNLYRWDDE